MDTNVKLLTVDDIFRMEGRQKGWSPSDAELKAAQATVNDLNRNRLSPPQFMSLTNQEGRVIDVLMKPSGEPIVVEPKVQNTQQGIVTMINPTNAVPVVNPQTQQPYMGYAADPMMGGMPQPAPLAGGQMTATNAPTAAPAQTPTPSPTPAPSFVVEATADEIRQRYPNAPANLVPGMTIRLKSGGAIVVK